MQFLFALNVILNNMKSFLGLICTTNELFWVSFGYNCECICMLFNKTYGFVILFQAKLIFPVIMHFCFYFTVSNHLFICKNLNNFYSNYFIFFFLNIISAANIGNQSIYLTKIEIYQFLFDRFRKYSNNTLPFHNHTLK